jgi:hypothetical protein
MKPITRMSALATVIIFLALLAPASLHAQQVSAGWKAYNDCVYDATQALERTDPNGQLVHYKGANVTTFGIGSGFSGSSSGQLIDQATGASTGVTVALTQSGGVTWQPGLSTGWYGGYDTATGTDARATFGGIADMTGVIYYGSSTGWYVDLSFSGLDPDKTYTFATSAARCNADYTDRGTIYTISGVDAATNASTAGTQEYQSNPLSVWFNTGDNYDEGYVARWTGIRPGDDGSFTVRATHHPNANSGYKAYSFDVFMLQEDAAPTCLGDFDDDGDVDGKDLAALIDDPGLLSDIAVFAGNFGKTTCP